MEVLAPVSTVPIYRQPRSPFRAQSSILVRSKERLAKSVARPASRDSKGTNSSPEPDPSRRTYSTATAKATVVLPPSGSWSAGLVNDFSIQRDQRTLYQDPHPGTPWDWAKRTSVPKYQASVAGTAAATTPTEEYPGVVVAAAGNDCFELEGDIPLLINRPRPRPRPRSRPVRNPESGTSSSSLAKLTDAEISPVDKPQSSTDLTPPAQVSTRPAPRLKLFPSPPRQAPLKDTRRNNVDIRSHRSHAGSISQPNPSVSNQAECSGAAARPSASLERSAPSAFYCQSPTSIYVPNSDRIAPTDPTRYPNIPPPPPPKPLSYHAAKKMAPNQTSSYASGSSAAALNPTATYQHIQDMAAKRISTLDYLRKTHEGRVYWFNTLLFSQPDILRLPSFQPPRLARRASALLLLGLSIPAAVDSSAQSALDYVRALNALLTEFETYQQMHPTEGGTGSLGSGSFSRAKLPKMFRGSVGGKNRRASTATDIGLPLPPGFDSVVSVDGGTDSLASSTASLTGTNPSASTSTTTIGGIVGSSIVGGASSTNSQHPPSGPRPPGTNTAALPAPDASMLLPGEEYTYLLTPSIPFEPDFFEVFATLSEVLIDVYMRIAALVTSPEKVALQPGLPEAFSKADARIRKLLVLGIVKEFEDSTRTGVKGEMAGVGRVVLGGLI